MLGFGAPPARAPEPTGFLQLEDGAYLLNEIGGRISLNAPLPPPLHGLVWEKIFDYPDASLRLYDIAYANGIYVTVGGQGVGYNEPVAFSSLDGLIWTQIVFPFSFAAGAFFTAAVYGAGNWVLTATTSITGITATMCYVSGDLVNWTSGPANLNAITGLAVNGSTFVATSRNDLLYYSTTLDSWSPCMISGRQLTSNEVSTYWTRKNLRSENGFFFVLNHYAFGVSNTGMHKSADGITWERIPVAVNGTARQLTSISFIAGQYYGTASGLPPVYSADLQTWTAAAGATAYGGVAYTEGTFLAGTFISGQLAVLTSQSGLAFTTRVAKVMPPSAWERIIGTNGRFVILDAPTAAAGAIGSIYTSL